MKISVIVPAYNESEGVRSAYEAIKNVMEGQLPEHDWELLFVDDGSTDDSFTHIRALSEEDAHVRGLRFSSNRGSHMAIRAGFDHATGDVACFIACDLQDPPELIPGMLQKLDGEIEIVAAARNKRDDPLLTRFFAASFYALARALVSRDLPPGGASMFLLGPKALKSVGEYREHNLTLEGMFLATGYKQGIVRYDRRSRTYGESKWTYRKRLKLFADFFVAYSYAPIRMVSIVGALTALIGVLYGAAALLNSGPVEGWTIATTAVLLVGGTQMIMLGIVGEYVWRALDEARGRPNYIIYESVGENA